MLRICSKDEFEKNIDFAYEPAALEGGFVCVGKYLCYKVHLE